MAMHAKQGHVASLNSFSLPLRLREHTACRQHDRYRYQVRRHLCQAFWGRGNAGESAGGDRDDQSRYEMKNHISQSHINPVLVTWTGVYVNFERAESVALVVSLDHSIQGTERRRALLEYVQSVDPKVASHFSKAAPATVVEAMRTTVTRMLGTIPPQYFDVRVSSTSDHLAQLMYSVLWTGYMFKSAVYRLDLRNTLSGGDTLSVLADIQEAAPAVAIGGEETVFAAGTQKVRVEGQVLRWHVANDSPESMPALDYIHMLERENHELKAQNAVQLRQRAAGESNGLLAYLKTLEVQEVELLTHSASDDVIEAMNTFVHKLLAQSWKLDLRLATKWRPFEIGMVFHN